MRENKVLAACRTGGQTIGCWLSIGDSYASECMASIGFDWVCIDMQHGMLGYTELRAMLPALARFDTVALVRPTWNDPGEIMKALDTGAAGVVVPMVSTRAQAERAVAACRFPPEGIRSFGPGRATLNADPDYFKRINSQIACFAMIETSEGLENLDAIASTPGLSGIYIGPSDLACALGLEPSGDNSHPKHAEAVGCILAACRSHGIGACMHTGSVAYTKRYLKQGFNLVMLGSDRAWMMGGALRDLAEARRSMADN